jgi:hypothetical protein
MTNIDFFFQRKYSHEKKTTTVYQNWKSHEQNAHAERDEWRTSIMKSIFLLMHIPYHAMQEQRSRRQIQLKSHTFSVIEQAALRPHHSKKTERTVGWESERFWSWKLGCRHTKIGSEFSRYIGSMGSFSRQSNLKVSFSYERAHKRASKRWEYGLVYLQNCKLLWIVFLQIIIRYWCIRISSI